MIPTALGLVGFSSTGVIAGELGKKTPPQTSYHDSNKKFSTGSAAAGLQAGMGGTILAGSAFSLAQSFAMGGAAAVVAGTVGTVLVGGAAVGAVALGTVQVLGILC